MRASGRYFAALVLITACAPSFAAANHESDRGAPNGAGLRHSTWNSPFSGMTGGSNSGGSGARAGWGGDRFVINPCSVEALVAPQLPLSTTSAPRFPSLGCDPSDLAPPPAYFPSLPDESQPDSMEDTLRLWRSNW